MINKIDQLAKDVCYIKNQMIQKHHNTTSTTFNKIKNDQELHEFINKLQNEEELDLMVRFIF